MNSSEAVLVARAVVARMNNLIRDHLFLCAALDLKAVVDLEEHSPRTAVLHFKEAADPQSRHADSSDRMAATEVLYRVTLQTAPNNGLYEATVRHLLENDRVGVKVAQISRINKYADQPACIAQQHPRLREFCYCKGGAQEARHG